MNLALDLFTIVAVSLGAIFFLAGTVGLLRFPDTLTRLHALTKADNLGLGLVVLGLLPQVNSPLAALGLLAVWLFALLSGATVGQLLAGAVRPPDWDRPGLDRAPQRDDGAGSRHD
jgi:multicomponent Na+:H+ antiporter subunit G